MKNQEADGYGRDKRPEIEQESPADAKGTRDSSACMKAQCPLQTNVKSVKTSILVLKVIQGHCFWCQSKPVYDILLVINCNLGPISHRFRDMATFRFKSLPTRAAQPFEVIQGHRS